MDFGVTVAKIFNKYNKIFPRKKVLETLSFVLPAKTTVRPNSLENKQNCEFPKSFLGGYLFVSVEYF